MQESSDADNVLKESFWSLADVLAWVAARDSKAILHARKNNSAKWTIRAWVQIDETEQHYAKSAEDAWQLLSEAFCDGLTAFGTQHNLHWSNGMDNQQRGAVFPPAETPGAALNYKISKGVGELILVPDRPKGTFARWMEWSDLKFKASEVRKRFPTLERSGVENDCKTRDRSSEPSVVVHLHKVIHEHQVPLSLGVEAEQMVASGSADPIAIEHDGEKPPESDGANPFEAYIFLLRMAKEHNADIGPRLKHREWLELAKKDFGIPNHVAVNIYKRMPDGFRELPGRPKSNLVPPFRKKQNAS